MTLYKSIANYYDEIFPLKRARLSFVESFFDKTGLHILDIGCAGGELALALSRSGHHVTGIDLDRDMIALAGEKTKNTGLNVEFLEKDMEKVGADFPLSSFDAVLCFGNTLVHLDNLEKIEAFLRGVFKILKKGGIFILQVVNYDRVLAERVNELPLLDREHVTFHRQYHFDEAARRIRFHTRLTVKETGKIVENSHWLYPLTSGELKGALEQTGFSGLQFFGTESKEPYRKHSPALIAVGNRQG